MLQPGMEHLLPLTLGGEVVGAIGVSGMQSKQGAQIAQARADGWLEYDA